MFVVHGDQSDLCLVLPQKPTQSTQNDDGAMMCGQIVLSRVEMGFESGLTERKLQSTVTVERNNSHKSNPVNNPTEEWGIN